MKSGIITIVGAPNVGKSTLMNKIIGEKIAIVSDKPQTTRNRIYGVLTQDDCQYVFLDTPGLHRAKTRLGDYMVSVVRQSVVDVDAVVLMVNPVAKIGPNEQELLNQMKNLNCPRVLVINKLDTLDKKDLLLEVMDLYQAEMEFTAIIPVSALKGTGVDGLLTTLKQFIPDGPPLFPPDMVTDQPERQVMAEILREKLLRNLDKEVPHGTVIDISKFSQRDNDIIDVEATIYCEKNSHKGIIIGKHGATLKKISTSARKDMEHFMGEKVYLQTWVKVKENWRDNSNFIRNFGYSD